MEYGKKELYLKIMRNLLKCIVAMEARVCTEVATETVTDDLCPWADYSTSLTLWFLACKMRIRISASWSISRVNYTQMCVCTGMHTHSYTY